MKANTPEEVDCVENCKLTKTLAENACEAAQRTTAAAKAVLRATKLIKAACDDQYRIAHPYQRLLRDLPNPSGGVFGNYYNLSELRDSRIDELPYIILILLESSIRNADELQVEKADVENIIDWKNTSKKSIEIPFKPARILLQHVSGVPALVDLAAMRDAMENLNDDPGKINPLVPVELVIDTCGSVDMAKSRQPILPNMYHAQDTTRVQVALMKARNRSLKTNGDHRDRDTLGLFDWALNNVHNLRVLQANYGSVHQVNVEYLARVVFRDDDGLLYPDSVLGTDYHTNMVNGLSVAGWSVGGLDAAAIMFGQPLNLVLPEVLGFKMTGEFGNHVTATDVALTVFDMLAQHGVKGMFVEFYGQGVSQLSVPDRATIANMSIQCGATMGFFPVDSVTLGYLRQTGRGDKVSMIEQYSRANKIFLDNNETVQEKVYSAHLALDLAKVERCLCTLPQDFVCLKNMKTDWNDRLTYDFFIPSAKLDCGLRFGGVPGIREFFSVKHGIIVKAAITSCTNTLNPTMMLCACLVAKKAFNLGLKVKSWVSASMFQDSSAIISYLENCNLLCFMHRLGFTSRDAGCGCTTCIDYSTIPVEALSRLILEDDYVDVTLLSSNCNFEWSAHQLSRTCFLASPPLVVAYALVGYVNFDFESNCIGKREDGEEVYLRNIWPSLDEINQFDLSSVVTFRPQMFKEKVTRNLIGEITPYKWNAKSLYISSIYFKSIRLGPPVSHGVEGAYCLLKLGNRVTTEQISPAGNISRNSPACNYLKERDCTNLYRSYVTFWGNDEVMARSIFADHIRTTVHIPTNEELSVFEAAMKYKEDRHDTIIIAGGAYGSGRGRDWAAKGLVLLGVKAVIAKSFERTHERDLIRMGVVPLCFKDGEDADILELSGRERYTIDLSKLTPRQATHDVTVKTQCGKSFTCILRLGSKEKLNWYNHGGMFPYIISQLK